MSETESFETSLCELMGYFYDNSYATRLCERIRRAHDREIRDVSQQQYDRGYIDGTHSMDAEHRAIAMRLRALRFDGGSHENLARIAYAIYPCATGWTCESADGLRDKLIDLLGGVSDDTCGAGCCCAAADCDGDCGLQREEVEHGGAAHDCAADTRGGSGSELVHLDGLVAYDVLDNERRNAIAGLRDCNLGYTLERDNVAELFSIFGTNLYDTSTTMAEKFEVVRDRLIHLLGGDKPSGIDVLREMDGESDDDGTCPNDDPTSSITDELRKWASDRHCKGISHTDMLNIGLIADRIDEQFDRICAQQEAVLQSTIDSMCEEQDRLQKRLRTAELGCEANHRLAEANARWCDELVDLLRDARDEYKTLDQMSAETSANFHAMRDRVWGLEAERDELQAKLDAIRNALDG